MTKKIYPGDPRYLEPIPNNDPRTCCPERDTFWTCTRLKGHDGDHAAHGTDNGQFYRWPQEAVDKTKESPI